MCPGLWRPRDLPSHTCVPPDANALELFKNKETKVVTRYIRCVGQRWVQHKVWARPKYIIESSGFLTDVTTFHFKVTQLSRITEVHGLD